MFKDVADIKKHLAGVQKNLSDKTLLPYVDQAAEKYAVPVLGREFYDELKTVALAEAAPEDVDVALAIVLLQRALAYYAQLEALPFLLVAIGDLGAVEVAVPNAQPIRQWNYKNLEAATAANADTFLDQFLHHLELHAEKFPTWEASPEYTVAHELLINNTGELNRHLAISNSRRAFLALRPYLVRATDLHLVPLAGPDLMARLLDPPADVPTYKTAAGLMAKALAQFAMVEALPELALQLNGAGFRLLTDHDGIRERLNAREEDRAARLTKALTLATQYLATAKNYFEANVDTMPEYTKSPAYEGRGAGAVRPARLKDNAFKPSFRV